MADERAYRVVVTYDRDGGRGHIARIPELGVEAHAETRIKAIEQVEQALEDHMASTAAAGEVLPPAIDDLPPGGEVRIQLADAVHRDLLHHARASNMSLEAYTGQLIARALGSMRGDRRPAPRSDRETQTSAPTGEGDMRGNERATERPREDREGAGRGRGGGRRRDREGYRPELDDKANFLEYLRGLEKGGGGRGRR